LILKGDKDIMQTIKANEDNNKKLFTTIEEENKKKKKKDDIDYNESTENEAPLEYFTE